MLSGVIRLGPYADFADLCPEPIFALVAALDKAMTIARPSASTRPM
jgi:hypothetical protein